MSIAEERQRVSWQLAGMTMDDPLPAGQWVVPGIVALVGDHIVWRGSSGTMITTRDGLLDGFLGLATRDDEAVLRFAQRWGVIRYLDLDPQSDPALEGLVFTEERMPVAAWRDLSSHFRALLTVAATEHQGLSPRATEWAQLGRDDHVRVQVRKGTVEAQVAQYFAGQEEFSWLPFYGVRGAISGVLDGWLRRAPTVLQLAWTDRAQVVLRPKNLLGAIVLQTMYSVAKTEGLAMCVTCGKPYSPRRRPAAGRRNYCDECRADGAANRDSVRAYRKRRGQERSN